MYQACWTLPVSSLLNTACIQPAAYYLYTACWTLPVFSLLNTSCIQPAANYLYTACWTLPVSSLLNTACIQPAAYYLYTARLTLPVSLINIVTILVKYCFRTTETLHTHLQLADHYFYTAEHGQFSAYWTQLFPSNLDSECLHPSKQIMALCQNDRIRNFLSSKAGKVKIFVSNISILAPKWAENLLFVGLLKKSKEYYDNFRQKGDITLS